MTGVQTCALPIFCRGQVSLAEKSQWREEIGNSDTQLSLRQCQQIARVFTADPTDMHLDCAATPGWASAGISEQEIELFQSAFVHLVTETVFYPRKQHLTEKIFRPIVMCRPFILAGAVGNLAYLRSYGFQTFSKWWDESYDEETDAEQRLTKIADIIADLCQLSHAELQAMYIDMLPVIEHNQQHFYNTFPSVIVDELLDNYVQLLQTWNAEYQQQGPDLRPLAQRWQEHQHSVQGSLGTNYYDIDSLNIPRLRKIWTS